VRLVISDAHEGLTHAISTVLSGTTWQRCRLHFMRNVLATVPHAAREAIAAIVRTIFAQPDHASAHSRSCGRWPRGCGLALPRRPRCSKTRLRMCSRIGIYRLSISGSCTARTSLERLNREIKRRSQVVGIFPSPAAVIRLVGAALLEQDDEWAVAERRYFSAESMSQPTASALSSTAQEIMQTLA
jgi:putative transposase